jgi:tRNA-(ms[2]io[6]A)-hydroxylase
MSASQGGAKSVADATTHAEVLRELPLLVATRPEWAGLAAANLPAFAADHAVCEQQVAMYALSLAGYYPGDLELVERAGALAAEEVQHFRRVVALLGRRGWPLAGRRTNHWARALRQRIEVGREPITKVDRLLFGAVVEARSCERFTALRDEIRGTDAELASLLADLGPAEKRHWEMFRDLAGREMPPDELAARFQSWLELERDLQQTLGVEPTVHG